MNSLLFSSSQVRDNLRRLTYFREMDRECLDKLVEGTRQVSVPKGEFLLRRGEPVKALHLVVSGQLRLYIPLSHKAGRVVALIEQGESFGEACLVVGEPSPVHAQAVASSHVLLVDGLVFGSALRRHGAMAGPVLSVVARQLLTVLRDMEVCAQPSSLQKVVCFLLRHRPARATEFEFELSGNKKDIAAKLGMAHETLSRTFGLLGQKNLIDVDQRRIRVKDATRLALFNPDGCE